MKPTAKLRVSTGLMAGIYLTTLFSASCASTVHLAGNNTHKARIVGSALAYESKVQDRVDTNSAELNSIASLPAEEQKAKLDELLSSRDQSSINKQETGYVLARLLQKSSNKDDTKRAIDLYKEASTIEPLWERCQWHIADCAQVLGQEKLVRQCLEQIRDRSESRDTKASAEYGLAQSYLRGSEQERARLSFADIREKYSGTPFFYGACYYLGEILLDSKQDQKQALALFRSYLKTNPDGHFATTIVKRLLLLPDFEATPYDRALFAKVHMINGEWQDALNDFAKANQPGVWYPQSVCMMHLGQKSQAMSLLETCIKAHPDDAQIPDAASYLSNLLTKDQALSLWQTILKGTKKYQDLALWNVAIRSQPPQSLSYYQKLVSQFPHSQYAADSWWWLLWNNVTHNKTSVALTQAQQGVSKFAGSRAQARFAFWIGKIQEKLNHRDLAKQAYKKAYAQFSHNYYGHRSAARLSVLSTGTTDRGWSTFTQGDYDHNWAWPIPQASFSQAQITAQCGPTCAILWKLCQWDECFELLPAKTSATIRAVLLAKLNLPLDAIGTAAKQISGAPHKAILWFLAYPLLYADFVGANSQSKHLDPYLVHALIREESHYDTFATSHSNALGLMQLMPATAYSIAKTLGISIHSNDDIYKPENNIAMGTSYIAYVLERFSGNALLSVASYNGGPNAVAGWLEKHGLPHNGAGATDWDFFVEDIPITQTRDYVRKVFGSYWNYEKIYTGK